MNQYLQKLRFFVALKFEPADTEDILSDYKAFFEKGLKEGKTEKQIINELGTPKELALNLSKENKLPIISLTSVLNILSLPVLLMLVALNWNVICQKTVFSFLLIAVSLFGLWFLLGGNIKSIPKYCSFKDKKSNRLLLLQCLTLFFTLITMFFQFMLLRQINKQVIPFFTVLNFLLTAPAAVFSSLLIIGILGLFLSEPYYYSLICHAGGSLYSALLIYSVYINSTDIAAIKNSVIYSFIPYIIGIFLSVFFYGLIKRIQIGQCRK